ncbi:bifunctional UDP-N-acetylglucosamine diphosphorylase/glucosamine-1-phosphate N-acetyltransferase GlmU [Minwuia sp.]|uniref:bifunctional UDP-N-acetylglucosamine diphosphorylase/glucosamine-1-phosphate N-acetyltransferase GlmU n=1 Tax=Minwuia sp. TaxID=2493630 RepID=UPI003A921BA2
MGDRAVAAVILAAGMGTRMKSALPKVLHPVAGRPMIQHIQAALAPLKHARTIVITSTGQDDVRAAVAPAGSAVQDPALGTAHAVLAAREQLKDFDGTILVLFGDTPLLKAETIQAMAEIMEGPDDPAVAVLGFRPDDPAAYGRLITDGDGTLEAIVEFRECTEAQKQIDFCNAGIMALDGRVAVDFMDRIGNDNSKGEYYLTDIVAIARAEGRTCVTVEGNPEEVMGVDHRGKLAEAEAVAQRRLREAAMAGGATLIAPETVFFCHDTEIGQDVTIEPHVVFGPGVKLHDNVHVKAFSHLEGAEVFPEASVGPYARLRPGAEIHQGAKIGNFVEVKKATIEKGAKVSHLTYIGDARVGAEANIGAGTITCNYDGYFKYRTDIGAGAFIGSNTALVAPVTIGDGAIVGAGSTIAKDVEADAMALTRGDHTLKAGWAARFRKAALAKKAKK